MLEPLGAKEDFRKRFDLDDAHREAWRSLAEEPLGRAIEHYLKDDLLRGLVLTDAKIGVFTHPHDPSLLQNRCFIYHLIGNKTGEWKCGGRQGRVALELNRRRARAAPKCLRVSSSRSQRERTTQREFELDARRNGRCAFSSRELRSHCREVHW